MVKLARDPRISTWRSQQRPGCRKTAPGVHVVVGVLETRGLWHCQTMVDRGAAHQGYVNSRGTWSRIIGAGPPFFMQILPMAKRQGLTSLRVSQSFLGVASLHQLEKPIFAFSQPKRNQDPALTKDTRGKSGRSRRGRSTPSAESSDAQPT